MVNFEGVPASRVRYGTALSLAVVMLAGCGGGSKKQEGIPSCPSGYESSLVVTDQDGVISAFEMSGQKLATDYKLATGRDKKRLGVAFSQLFSESGNGQGLFHSTINSGSHLTPDSYLADDPNELMCQTKSDHGDEEVVLSPNAIEARTILESVGLSVKLNHSVS